MQAVAFTCILLLASFSRVLAHGYVNQIAIDGTWYAGNPPTLDVYQGPSPIRQISDFGPIKGADNDDLKCGIKAQKAELVIPANPGSVFTAQWKGGDNIQNWPHDTGPLMTYMASCGSTPCNEFDPTGAKWFKIDQLGLKPDGNTWWQDDILNNGAAYQVTLPQDLAPGGYLIRHEIIALHLAVTLGGAEFYASCTQVMIGGNGKGSPLPTVSFPGAYNDNDPGIFDPSVFDAGANYTFPGGPISNLAGTNAQMVAGAQSMPPFPTGTNIPSPTVAPSSTGEGSVSASSPATTRSAATSSSSPTTTHSAATRDPAPTPSDTTTGSIPSGTSASICSLKRHEDASIKRRHFKRLLRRIMPLISH